MKLSLRIAVACGFLLFASQVNAVYIQDDGERKSFSKTLDGPGEYLITVDGNPTDEMIELAVPSDAAE